MFFLATLNHYVKTNRCWLVHVIITLFSFFGASAVLGQKGKLKNHVTAWRQAVINIETQGFVHPKYYVDSLANRISDSLNLTQRQFDSLINVLNPRQITTGTAIYVTDNERRYLITAKHVLFDNTIVEQKTYETRAKIADWSNDLTGIVLRISVRTPYSFQLLKGEINNYAVINNNFSTALKPYSFISDKSGDGIAILSLQEKNYRLLDTLLQRNGYVPIALHQILTSPDDISIGDDIFTIGYPEMMSVVAKGNVPNNVPMQQLSDFVTSITCFGKVAMIDSMLPSFFVDLTITPGNSGGPIIKKNKLIGIVSGINKYSILTDNVSQPLAQHLYGIGHLVNIIKVDNLRDYITALQKIEDSAGFNK